MPAIVLVGAQWGDEGKGKATDLLGHRVDYVVRYQGGNNAAAGRSLCQLVDARAFGKLLSTEAMPPSELPRRWTDRLLRLFLLA